MQLICGLTPQAFADLFVLFLVVAAAGSLVWHTVGELTLVIGAFLIRRFRILPDRSGAADD